MRRYVLLLPLACLSLLAWSLVSNQPTGDADSPRSAVAGDPLQSLVVSPPLRYGNLSIFPVSSKVPRNQDRFITLDEGLKAGTVEIFEVGADGHRVDPALNETEDPEQPLADVDGQVQAANQVDEADAGAIEFDAEVNRLMVVNRSDRPLYLMPGEVIVGGQQDRTIAQETILASSNAPVPIDVYCVEHGRWSDRPEAEGMAVLQTISSAGGVSTDGDSLNRLVQEANRGKFVASAGALNKQGRLAAQAGEGQDAVWERVETVRGAFDSVSGDSGAFTENYVDAEVRRQLEPYLAALRDPVSRRQTIVGVIVAVNGKIEAVDVFESTPLFRKLWPKLLKSYALDAAIAADEGEPGRDCTLADARNFLKESLEADVEKRTETTGGLVVTKRATGKFVSFSFGGGLGGLGGFGGAGGGEAGGSGVHASAFAK